MRNELVKLVTIIGYQEDNDGFKTDEDTKTVEIFAEVKSVGRSEFYEAARTGMKVDVIFSVNPDDFAMGTVEIEGEKKKPSRIIYDDTVYLIKRTYKKDIHVLEITCGEVE